MRSRYIIPALFTVIAVGLFLTANIPAYSAEAGYQVAAGFGRDTREPSRPQSGASGYAAGQTSSRYTCSGGVCSRSNYADCSEMALAEQWTVEFSQCTGCPNMPGWCTPGQ
jgi:hypothetical protein